MIKTDSFSARQSEAIQYLQHQFPQITPTIGVILGSGVAEAIPQLEQRQEVAYEQIPYFPKTTVPGHDGKLIFGRLHGQSVVVMQGRFHYYEGHAMSDVNFPIRILAAMGVKTLLVTAAVGSMKTKIQPGHFVVVKDHINWMGHNPLRGQHQSEFGDMFPSLVNAYDKDLQKTLLSVCRRQKKKIHQGIYVASHGPSYETVAEISAFRKMGGDVVGMSVIPEILTARQLSVRCAALVWVSNMAAGLAHSRQDHEEVLALGKNIANSYRSLLTEIISFCR